MDKQVLTPELRAALKDEIDGLEQAAYERGKQEGATAERERIAAVEAKALPGHEALVAEMKFDGKTTGPEAAERILAAEKQKRAKALKDLTEESAQPAQATVSKDGSGQEAAAASEKDLPVEERSKLEWERKPELRKEFTSLQAFIAFTKATEAGHARILSRPQ